MAVPPVSEAPSRIRWITPRCRVLDALNLASVGIQPRAPVYHRCVAHQLTHRQFALECAYRTLYNRGSWRHLRRKLPVQPSSTAATTADLTLPAEGNLTLSHPAEPTVEGVEESTENENAVISAGDASVHNFLHKVSEHLTLIGQALPRNLLRWEEEILNTVGDRSTFVFPPRDTAREYLNCYFEHANVTYRYLLRTETFAILDRVYDDDEAVFEHPATIAILLFAMGVGCIWLASRHSRPLTKQKSKSNHLLQAGQTWLDKTLGKFPPTLNMIKATVLKCQLECAASRHNSAWMTLGMAVRLGQIIGIEREVASTGPSEQFSRKGVFWAMYMLDRYLSVSLGRPMAIRDEDITIACPTDLDHETITLLGPQETKVWLGVVAHARLTRIIGCTITRLYPASKHLSDDARDRAVTELERDLQEWENQTPSFFLPPEQEPLAGSQHDFYAIPWIFQRQQKTITAAYHFTCILMYRGDLLREFLHHEPGTPAPSQPSSARIRHCVNHAMAIARIAANIADDSTYNGVYWTTSHFVFCAISVLLVYLALYHAAEDRGAIEEMVEKAMKGHRKLDSSYNFRTQRLLEAGPPLPP
ncbi:hypothetical protein BO86DRAFT_413302 [Aspergillus japonicus CBS 114.51]|uniref:Xylanolytic transcriptional activator regulatory domain-containing protein n=1 Tax=Aspergillus japonicus CBS 114.51 TaxID=1448312 RepID=A0A8T8WNL4_ASPJA|nr:hypothetical protein BO86DRAFT_413302 [Aspergillus japonicus CBS 114.51]RAH77200.1 hypothetical protein BO86DRAFT_413302 [Aspergillus japonicus CBS 114.51]